MLRPKNIHDNLENFNSVTRDAIDHMVAIRGADRTIPDLEGELAKYATECKFNLSSLFFSQKKSCLSTLRKKSNKKLPHLFKWTHFS